MLYNEFYAFIYMNWRELMEKFKVYLAEFLGTMLLVGIGTGAALFTAPAAQGSGIIIVAFAFAFAFIISAYAFGAISGAHLNPAVSFAMAINKRMSWLDFVGYAGAQVLGAIAGSTMIFGVISGLVPSEVWNKISLGATTFGKPNPFEISALTAGMIEAVLTFVLVLVILMVTSEKFGAGAAAGIVIALTLAALIFVGGNLTGASLNPARSFGPAMVQSVLGNTVAMGQMGVYLIGPMVGGALAAVTAKFFGSEEAA